jgi:hypothetical protein
MGYRTFTRWVRKNQIGVYVPYEFSELVSNKRKAYAAVREHDEALHPHTENFTGSSVQVASFLERTGLVFLKPRSGNKGNGIFVLRREDDGLSMKYYDTGAQRSFSSINVEAAVSVVDAAAGTTSYIIQDGIDSLEYDGAVFDVRVVMVHDGKKWHSILETRLAPQGSDLSNIFQGGSIQVTEELLAEILGDERARGLEGEIRAASHALAEHFESLFPGELMEIGFDLVLDRELKIHLVEVNSKPGVAGFGSETKIFDWQPEDESYYRKWVYPHVEHLAAFLKSKFDRP